MKHLMQRCKLCQILSGAVCNDCCPYQYHALIEAALRRFIKEDKHLSELDVNERSQTHKLAEYIQNLIPEYNVDCEYNKNLRMDKKLDFTQIVESIKAFLRERGQHIENPELEKILEQLRKELNKSSAIYDEGSSETPIFLQFTSEFEKNKKYIKHVYPDIIAHLRGTNTNKIVIEAKKESNKDKTARLFDLIKLGLFTEQNGQFGYEAGYFIDLPSWSIPDKFEVQFIPERLVPNSNVFIVKIVAI